MTTERASTSKFFDDCLAAVSVQIGLQLICFAISWVLFVQVFPLEDWQYIGIGLSLLNFFFTLGLGRGFGCLSAIVLFGAWYLQFRFPSISLLYWSLLSTSAIFLWSGVLRKIRRRQSKSPWSQHHA